MAIAAVDPVAADVPLVAELDWLPSCDVLVGDPRRAIRFVQEPDEQADEEERAKYREARNGVGASMKDLGH